MSDGMGAVAARYLGLPDGSYKLDVGTKQLTITGEFVLEAESGFVGCNISETLVPNRYYAMVFQSVQCSSIFPKSIDNIPTQLSFPDRIAFGCSLVSPGILLTAFGIDVGPYSETHSSDVAGLRKMLGL